MAEIGFYEIVKARYVLFLRKKEVLSRAKKKTASELKRLSELSKEKQEILTKIIEQKAAKNDYAKLKQINNELIKIRDTISNKTRDERKIARYLSTKIKQFDSVITTLVVEDYEREVVKPIQDAIESRRPELAEVVVVSPGAPRQRGAMGAFN